MEFPGPFFKLFSTTTPPQVQCMVGIITRIYRWCYQDSTFLHWKSEILTIFYFIIFCYVGEQEAAKAQICLFLCPYFLQLFFQVAFSYALLQWPSRQVPALQLYFWPYCHSSTVFIGISLFKLSQHFTWAVENTTDFFFKTSTGTTAWAFPAGILGPAISMWEWHLLFWHSAHWTLSYPHICGTRSWQDQISAFSTVDWVRGASWTLQSLIVCTGTPAHAVLTMEFNFLPMQTETYVFVLKYAEVKLNRILSLERNEATP